MSVMTKVMATVAKVMPDRGADPLLDAHRHLGRPIDRLDGPAKVTGRAKFAAEVAPEGLLHAALVHSTIARGTITDIDTTAADAAPGVVAVITHRNASKMKDPPLFTGGGGTDIAGSKVNVLNTRDVSWNGQPVALVVADTIDRAEHAASLVRVTYDEQVAALSFEEAKKSQKQPKKILSDETEVTKGDAEAALAAAAFHVDLRFRTPFMNHNAIELHATTAIWEAPDRLVLHSASQNLQGEAGSIAEMFWLKPEQVQVHSPYVGGGFGSKGAMWSHVQLAVLAAKMVQRPVRLTVTREGVFRIVGGRTVSDQRVALGAGADGKLTALIHTGVTANSPDNEWPEQFTFPARHLYATDSYLISQTVARLNMTANTAMRAPGESIGTYALESALDELAAAIGIDPVALRIANEPEVDPVKGTPFSNRHLVEALKLGAEKFGWDRRTPEPRSMRDGEWLIGMGMATAFYPVYRMPSALRLTLRADGSALVQTSAQEMGMGTSTVQTQHAAERLGLPLDKITFEYGDSSLPPAAQAGGSAQTVSVALALQMAHEKLLKALLSLARRVDDSPLVKADVDDLESRDGGIWLKGQADAGLTYERILRHAGKTQIEAEAETGPALESMKYSMQSYGAQFCEVRVHEVTGEVRIARWVGAFDIGRALNPKLVASQLRGGIIMGIGMALMEESSFDERSGRIMNSSLAEYHVPVNADIPAIDVLWLDIPDPHTPLGAHGVGEIGITGTGAAVANAVFHATGKRIRDLPITLDKLL